MGILAETILERDKSLDFARDGERAKRVEPERGRRRGLWTTSRTIDAGAVQKRPAPKGKPAFQSSAALLLLDVLQRARLRRRALHLTKIRASSMPIKY